jgi:hypothetical protein
VRGGNKVLKKCTRVGDGGLGSEELSEWLEVYWLLNWQKWKWLGKA